MIPCTASSLGDKGRGCLLDCAAGGIVEHKRNRSRNTVYCRSATAGWGIDSGVVRVVAIDVMVQW